MTSIGRKVAHVKGARQTRDHACHWPGCTRQVKPALWGCLPHWYALPPALRARVWATYRAGQEEDGTPSAAYLEVAREIQNWIAANPSAGAAGAVATFVRGEGMGKGYPTEDETGAYPGSNAPDKSGASALPNQLALDRAELEALRRLAGTRAARDLLAERMRQVEAEGWTPAHDDRHRPHAALALAGACYALNAAGAGAYKAFWENAKQRRPIWWPWSLRWWKPRDPRRDLVRAGALILAELERLDRAEERAKRSAPSV